MVKLVISLIAGLVVGLALGWVWAKRPAQVTEMPPEAVEEPLTPHYKYSVEELGKRSYSSVIEWGEKTATEESFFAQKFYFDSDEKRVSGLAHIPDDCGKCPVIVQIRGYADPAVYQPGYGTWRSAEKFADAGFISLAPDFLGYGESVSPSADVFEERFEKYTTVLNLLGAVEIWDKSNGNIGIWGHSNGGQIALTVLEASERDYPTTLWAPVSAGFPYSILYYMDDNNPGDKELRKILVDFESLYETNKFNLLNYLDRIKVVIQLHQGTADASVPVEWNRNLAKELINIEYFEYPGADHNLLPAWSLAVERDIEFFEKYLRK